MSEDGQRDPYQVLGVAREADARAIKAAYFALVRQTPPETHPEAFQALRQAYEILSDPARREQLDASREAWSGVGDEIVAILRAAAAAEQQGDEVGAEALLRRAMADAPDLVAPLEQLGLMYLRLKLWNRAVGMWLDLVQRDPSSARYHLHLGYARHGMGQKAEAVTSYARALELGAGHPARLAMADALEDEGEWTKALAVLDEGLKEPGPPSPALVRRRLALLLLHGPAKRAWRAFDDLAAGLADRPAERAAHAEELATLAAWLFARNKQKEANELLRRLPAIDPERPPDRIFPSRSTVAVADLPAASVDWLAGRATGPARYAVSEGGRWVRLLSAVPALLSAGLLALHCSGDGRWGTGGVVFTFLLAAATALAIAWGMRRIRAALGSELASARLVHPVHYLEVDFDRVRVFPLVNLHDVQVVRHSTNGRYTHTMVHLPFGRKTKVVRFLDDQSASNFADALLVRRQRVLELMANGLLENQEGIDLVPSPLLLRGARLEWRRPLALAGAALAAAALVTAVAALENRRAGDARDWAAVRVDGRPSALRAWLRAHPGDAGAVKGALADWTAGLESGPDALPAGPGRLVALALARAVAEGASGTVPVEVVEAPDLPAALPGQERAPRLVAGLQAAADRGLGIGTLRFEAARAGATTGGLAVRVELAPRAAGTYSDGVGPGFEATAIDWRAALRRGDGAEVYEATGRAEPPPELVARRAWRYQDGREALPRRLLVRTAEVAAGQVAAAFGLPAVPVKEVAP